MDPPYLLDYGNPSNSFPGQAGLWVYQGPSVPQGGVASPVWSGTWRAPWTELSVLDQPCVPGQQAACQLSLCRGRSVSVFRRPRRHPAGLCPVPRADRVRVHVAPGVPGQAVSYVEGGPCPCSRGPGGTGPGCVRGCAASGSEPDPSPLSWEYTCLGLELFLPSKLGRNGLGRLLSLESCRRPRLGRGESENVPAVPPGLRRLRSPRGLHHHSIWRPARAFSLHYPLWAGRWRVHFSEDPHLVLSRVLLEMRLPYSVLWP